MKVIANNLQFRLVLITIKPPITEAFYIQYRPIIKRMYFFDYQIMEIIYTATRKKPNNIKGKYFIKFLGNLLNDFPL